MIFVKDAEAKKRSWDNNDSRNDHTTKNFSLLLSLDPRSSNNEDVAIEDNGDRQESVDTVDEKSKGKETYSWIPFLFPYCVIKGRYHIAMRNIQITLSIKDNSDR